VAAPAFPSSDDPETLKALLAEERAENERLRQIILAMQRHRFGRRRAVSTAVVVRAGAFMPPLPA